MYCRNCQKSHVTLFADDCILYTDGNNWPYVYRKLQENLSSVSNWCIENGFRMNAFKTRSMVVGNRTEINRIDFTKSFILDRKQVQYVKQFTHLGIVIDYEMSLQSLRKYVDKKTIFICYVKCENI